MDALYGTDVVYKVLYSLGKVGNFDTDSRDAEFPRSILRDDSEYDTPSFLRSRKSQQYERSVLKETKFLIMKKSRRRG